MSHDLLIECGAMSSDELRQTWEGMVDGITEANAHRIAEHPEWIVALLASPPTYELPRRRANVDQVCGTIDIVLKRRKATCVEWAAICAAHARVTGDLNARAVLVDQVDENDDPIPGAFHVIVIYGDGTDADVTQMLPGYHGREAWWLDHGHCCRDCALGINGARTTCTPCAAADAERRAAMPPQPTVAEMAGCGCPMKGPR